MRIRLMLLGFLVLSACSSNTSRQEDVTDGAGLDSVGDLRARGDGVSDLQEQDLADQLGLDLVSTPDRAGDQVGDVAWVPPFEPAVCGMESYQWLDPGTLGEVVLLEELLLSKLDPETIDGMLAEQDIQGLPPSRYGIRNFRFRYTTQDKGVQMEATGTIGIPWGENVPWPAPVMLWLHGTTGFSDDCSPSRDLLMSAAVGALWSTQGYVVIAPDYLGLTSIGDPSPEGYIHPYLVGEATAIASLDALKAGLRVLDEEDVEGSADPQKLVIMGGSQGGHAALFTDRYQPYYAPEFHIVGVVDATGPMDLTGEGAQAMSQLVNATSSFLFALVAMKNWYGHPEALSGLFTNQEPLFIADKVEEYMSAGCSSPIDVSAIESLEDIFLPEIIEAAAEGNWEAIPPWGCYLEVNSIPGTPLPRLGDAPVLTIYSGNDELVNNGVEKANWPLLCEEGYSLQYLECEGLGHTAGAVASLPYAMSWLEDRLANIPLDSDVLCEIQEPVDCAGL